MTTVRRSLHWLGQHTATIGFVILAAGVVLALWRTYEQGQDRQNQLDDLQTATAYTCEVTKVLDSAFLQLQLIDIERLGDSDITPFARRLLTDRIEVFAELHSALLNEEPCATVE